MLKIPRPRLSIKNNGNALRKHWTTSGGDKREPRPLLAQVAETDGVAMFDDDQSLSETEPKTPHRTGRMLNTSCARSRGLAKLSPKALNLFFLLLPHLSTRGKMDGNPYTIKGVCCPLIDHLPLEEIGPLLVEISTHTNLKWFIADDGLPYLHSLSWEKNQKLRADRMGPDNLPSYRPPTERSGTTPGLLRDQSSQKVKNNGKGKVKGEVKEGEKVTAAKLPLREESFTPPTIEQGPPSAFASGKDDYDLPF